MLLKVKVMGLSGLVKSDLSGAPDTFVVLGCGNESPVAKTDVCFNSFTPVWDQVFEFVVSDPKAEFLNVILKARDSDDMDDVISFREIPVAGLCAGEEQEKQFELTPINGMRRGGKLRLKMLLTTTESDRMWGREGKSCVFTKQPQLVVPAVENLEYTRPKPLIGQGGKKGSGEKKAPQKKVKQESPHLPEVKLGQSHPPQMPILSPQMMMQLQMQRMGYPQMVKQYPAVRQVFMPYAGYQGQGSVHKGVEIPLQGVPFEGIIAYLTRRCKGSIVEQGIVGIAARDRISDMFHEKSLCQVIQDQAVYVSANEPGAWFCIDFKGRTVLATHYSVRGGDYNNTGSYMSSWTLEGSIDGAQWQEIHSVMGSDYPNPVKRDVTCSVATQRRCRFVRLRMTGPTKAGNFVLCCARFELFGVLYEM